jgi:uncharacterized alpha/beta hydrolase family protein
MRDSNGLSGAVLGFTVRMAAVGVCLFNLAGCSFLGLKKELNTLQTVAYYTGTVSKITPSDAPVIVVLYTEENGTAKPVMIDYLPRGVGIYHILVPGGNYRLLAFEDTHRNSNYDPGEPIALLPGEPQNARADQGGNTSDHLVIGDASGVDVPPIFGQRFSELVARLTGSIGEVTTLDDPRFDDSVVHEGVYQPLEFYRSKAGPRLYMLQPYDPNKLPVIFVHGMFGSPRSFRGMIAGLDPARFQPWVFYWPTGIRVEVSAWVLDESLEYLSYQYGFTSCDLVGYSMGGLVARTALNIRAKENRSLVVRNFISISTPWGGDPAATKGVKLAPIVVPSWHNMDPTGTYIHTLFDQSWPEDVRYSLFFGYGGGGGSKNTDGTVSLESVLDKDAEDRAAFIYGFNDDHESIPSDPEVIRKLSEQLEWDDAKGIAGAATRP